jgi:hypothetical protein
VSWKLYDEPWYRHADHGQTVVSLEDDGALCIDAEQGSGHMREAIKTYIPGEVMLWLLRPLEGLIGMAEAIRARQPFRFANECDVCSGSGNIWLGPPGNKYRADCYRCLRMRPPSENR